MKNFKLRRAGLAATLFAAVLGVECSGDTMVKPDNTDTSVNGAQSAKVRVLSEVRFPSCTDGQCQIEGTLVNDGPDCATSVRGVTHLLDADGKELTSVNWTFGARLRPNRQEQFSGCCISEKTMQAQRSSRTDVSFEALQCI